jgi:AcrR family transcriptional regulator
VAPPARKPGRPRSEQAATAILDATLHLLVETMSVDSVSIEAIAARAGVGKTTIYRRWPNKVELILEALTKLNPDRIDCDPDASIRTKLIYILKQLQRFGDRSLAGRLYLCMLVVQEQHPELVHQYFHQVLAPRRDQIRAVLARAVADGELRPDADIDTIMLMMTALQTRIKLATEPITDEIIEHTVDLLLNGMLANPSRSDAVARPRVR